MLQMVTEPCSDRLVQSTEQLAQFALLRNLSQTAPYMHGGHFDTLEEVIEHYSTLEESALQGHSDEVLAPLNWTDSEVEAMIAFLRLLDDSSDILPRWQFTVQYQCRESL